MTKQIAPPRLVQPSLVQPIAEDVKLGFRHRSLEPQQEAIVVVGRIVKTILVRQEGLEEGTQFQKLMPVLTRTGQSAHLDAQY